MNTLLFAMPGGMEWIILLILIASPIALVIVLISKRKAKKPDLEQLEKLNKLRKEGAISEAEYEVQKHKYLN